MFTKTALDVGVLRNFIKTKVSPKMIRYARGGRVEGNSDFIPGAISKYKDKHRKKRGLLVLRDHIRKDPSFANHIRQFDGGPSGFYKDMFEDVTNLPKNNIPTHHIVGGKKAHKNLNEYLGKFKSVPKLKTGKAKNIFNDLVLHHENNEIVDNAKMVKSWYGKGNRAKSTEFSSHAHPDVLFKEHNALATLSGAPEDVILDVQRRFYGLRQLGIDGRVLDHLIPGGYITGNRISRHARRRLSDRLISILDETKGW